MDRLNRWLISAIVFLIPSSMALHWYIPQAYIFAKPVDYLFPKLHLSLIPIIIFISINLLNYKFFNSLKGHLKKYLHHYLVVCLLFLLLSFTALIGPVPLSSLWSIGRIAVLLIFTLVLRLRYSPPKLLQLLYLPALATSIFQSLLALYQFHFQRQLIGYRLLGEPELYHAADLAKAGFDGAIKTLAYGTTAHPNVIAGLILIFLIWILGYTVYNPNSCKTNIISMIYICLFSVTIYITRSLTSLMSFVIVYLLLIYSAYRSRIGSRSYSRLIIYSIPIFILLSLISTYQLGLLTDKQSITRRYKLLSTSITLLRSQPLIGVGPNAFIPAAILTHSDLEVYRFPQPVHNIYALFAVENGLFAVIITLWLASTFIRRLRLDLSTLPLFLPLTALLTIGLLDHYPLTLQSGLLMFSFAIALLPPR